MTVTLDTIPAEIPRDRFSRPIVKKLDGKGTEPFTRCTTFVDCLSDTWNLSNWSQRNVAIGLSLRPDLLLSVSAHRDDKAKLQKLCDDAKEAAADRAGATTGTALHTIMEKVDRGIDPGPIPAGNVADVAAYVEATRDLVAEHIEEFCVLDSLKIGGTPDRVVKWTGNHPLLTTGKRYISDLKGLDIKTPIPTPGGWSMMGDLRPGDEVFGSDGKVCRVTATSKVKRIGTYVVTFDDGSKIVCDSEHIWWTADGQRANGVAQPRPIGDIIATLRRTDSEQCQHRVPIAGPLNLPDIELPIDPYVLGCWLGDGHTKGGGITKEAALFDILIADGHKLGKNQHDKRSPHVITRTVLGLVTQLKAVGLFGHKHVPDKYLRAGTMQRLRLLQGLMDTDGTWNKARRTAVFNSTDKGLAYAAEELLCTLGQRPHVAEYQATGYGKTVTAYAVEFTPIGMSPFRLWRKGGPAILSTKNTTKARRRVIVSVEPGPDVETMCIAVDSDNHTYLCGERMIPTHNTGASLDYGAAKMAMQLAVYARSQLYDIATGARSDHGAEFDKGLIVHLPAGTGVCTVYVIDLLRGWEGVKLARQVREWRSGDKRDTFLTDLAAPQLVEVTDPIMEAIAVATREELNVLWRRNRAAWTDVHTAAAQTRLGVLQAAS